MNSVPRKLTLGLVLALGAAACGDDVTVVDDTPGTPTAIVRSVVVTPASATISQGASFTFGASVDADAGVARTVTWSASGGTGITVDGNGVASASSTASGVASICATSTVEASVKGCAQLTISAVVNPTPATVQIDAITRGCDAINMTLFGAGGCGLNIAVPVNNVTGQIDVQVAVNRPTGTNAPTGVRVYILNAAGVKEDSVTETLTIAASTAIEGLAAQTVTNRIVASFQTANYDLSGPGGSAKVFHPNGPKTVRAVLLPLGTTTAVAERPLTFRNANGFHLNITTNLSAGALNANGVNIRSTSPGTGLSWNGGTPLALQAVAVNYDSRVAAAGVGTNVGFGSAACDQSGVGARTIAAAVTNNVLTGTLTYTNITGATGVGIASTTDVDQYEMDPSAAVCPAGVFGEIPFATALDAGGNAFINFPLGGPFGANNTLNSAAAPVNPALSTVPGVRLNNRGPVGGSFTIANATAGTAIINGRDAQWFNGDVNLTAVRTGGTSNGIVTATPVDLGVGGPVTFLAHIGLATVCTSNSTCFAIPGISGTIAANISAIATAVGNASGETVTNVAGRFTVEARDVFLNRVFATNGPLLVGIDVTAPSCVNNGSAADFAIMDAATGVFSVNCTDALSGFADPVPPGSIGSVQVSLIAVNGSPAGLVRTNVVGTGAISATPFATAAAGTFVNTPGRPTYTFSPTLITLSTPVPAGPDYFIYQARPNDVAGNASTAPLFVRRVYVNQGDSPFVTSLNASGTLVGGASIALPASATAAVEDISGELRVRYPNALAGAIDLIYSRPNPTIDPTTPPAGTGCPTLAGSAVSGATLGCFDDNMPQPASFSFGIGAFIRGLQVVDGAGAPAADFASAKPTEVRGRVYNPFGNNIGLMATSADPIPALSAVSGVSDDFIATIAAGQITTGTDFAGGAAPTAITFWGVTAQSCGGIVSGSRTCTFTVTQRGPTGTFLNRFPSGIAVVEDATTGAANFRVIGGPGAISAGATVVITPVFTAPFPTRDNGLTRDFEWTVTVTRVAGSGVSFTYGFIGLGTSFDGLSTQPSAAVTY